MTGSLQELRRKEVVDVITGERLGFIDDVHFDLDKHRITGFVMLGRRTFLGRREPDLLIPCESVRLYGKDVLLVELPGGVSANCTKIKPF